MMTSFDAYDGEVLLLKNLEQLPAFELWELRHGLYDDTLNSDEIRPVVNVLFDFQAKFNGLANALHQSIQ